MLPPLVAMISDLPLDDGPSDWLRSTSITRVEPSTRIDTFSPLIDTSLSPATTAGTTGQTHTTTGHQSENRTTSTTHQPTNPTATRTPPGQAAPEEPPHLLPMASRRRRPTPAPIRTPPRTTPEANALSSHHPLPKCSQSN